MKDTRFIKGTTVRVNSFTNREKEAEKLGSYLVYGSYLK